MVPWYLDWESRPEDKPEIEFTVVDLIESVTQQSGKIHHYFRGVIKCLVLPEGEQVITKIPSYDEIPAMIDNIHLEQFPDGTCNFYVRGGYNFEDSGTLIIRAWKGTDNNLEASIEMKDEDGNDIYATDASSKDVFTKVLPDIDVSWYLGTWTWEGCPEGEPEKKREIEFTVGKFLGKVEDPENEGYFKYYFTGTVNLSAPDVPMTEPFRIMKKPDPGELECVYFQKNPAASDAIMLYIRAGTTTGLVFEKYEIVKVDLWKEEDDDDNAYAKIVIRNAKGVVIYTTDDDTPDKFTKVSSP